MGLLRRDEGPGGARYRMRAKLFAIGDDYWIDTDDDRHAFKVNGKAMRIRDTFVLEGPSGEELFKAQERKLRVRDTMKVEREGEAVATIKKAMITPLRERFTIDVQDGGELSAKGNIVDHEYEIEGDGRKVAQSASRSPRARVHPRQRPPAGARVGEQARLRQRREVRRRLSVPRLAHVEVVLLAVEPQAALPAEEHVACDHRDALAAYHPLAVVLELARDRKSTRLNSSHLVISYA